MIDSVHHIGAPKTRARSALVNVEDWTLTVALAVRATTFVDMRRMMLARVHQIRVHETGIHETRLGCVLVDEVGEGSRSFIWHDHLGILMSVLVTGILTMFSLTIVRRIRRIHGERWY